MGVYQEGDIVLVPWPFEDKDASKVRPALVLSREAYNRVSARLILAMISSQVHRAVSHDVIISMKHPGFGSTRLRYESFVAVDRVVTLSQSRILQSLGRVPSELLDQVRANFLGFIS